MDGFHSGNRKMHFIHLHHKSADYGEPMKLNYLIDLAHGWMEQLQAMLAVTTPAEVIMAGVLPILALLISIRINQYIDSKPNRTLPAHAIDVIAPLLAPVLAILFTTIASILFLHLDMEPRLLTFVDKLCVAWLAVHVVMILSSGRTAGLFIALVIIPITLLHLFDVWEPTAAFMKEVRFTVSGVKFNLYTIAKSIIAFIFLLWAVNFVLDVVDGRLRRVRTMRASNRTLIMKFMQIGLYIIVFLFALNLVGVSLTTLSIFSGALGVGIGLGLQKIASNFISGIILLFEKSVEVGDLVVMEDGTRGFVRQTSARYTRIEKTDGSEALIPNENFINQQVINFTHTNHNGRGQIFIGVGYDSDLELVLKLLTDAAKSHPRCAKAPAPAAFVVGFADSAISTELDFWVDDIENGILGISSDISIAIVNSFREHGIVIPYPHQVALLPAEAGETIADTRRVVRTTKTKTKDAGSKQEAKQIAKAAPISKVHKE